MKNFNKSIAIVIVAMFAFLSINFSSQAQSSYTAKDYSEQFARKQMKAICPNTGYGSYAKVVDYSYNAYTETYTIQLETYWTGQTTFWSNQTSFEVDGKLTVYSDGSFRFDETWADSDTRTVRSNNSLLGIAAVGAYLIARD